MNHHHLVYLPYFVRAAKLGNFSAVARELGVSAVAVSKNIAALEATLGVRLFQRSTRSVSLTAEGRAYYERCAEPFNALEQAGEFARQESTLAAGPVRITCLRPFGRGYVIPLLHRFVRRYPQVQIEFSLDDRAIDLVEEEFDIGIRASGSPEPSIIARPLFDLSLVVCGSPDYFAQSGIPQSVNDLARHNCLRLGLRGPEEAASSRRRTSFQWRVGTLPTATPVEVAGNFAASDFIALESAALGGLGLVHAPLPMVLPHFRTGALRPVLPTALLGGIKVFIHYRSRRNLPQRTRLVIDYLVDELSHQPDLKGTAEGLCAPYWM